MHSRVAQSILKTEFETRSARNQSYSLRAYAKALGISHTVLSLVMNGKRNPSKNVVNAIAKNIDITAKQKALLIGKDNAEHVLTVPEFEVISDWVDYAILGLCEQPKMTLKKIVKRLDISHSRAALVVDRLLLLRFIAEDQNNCLRATKNEIRVPVSNSTASGREYNRRLLHKAEQSMDLLPFSTRSLTNIVFAMKAGDLSYAVSRIDEFRRSLSAELETQCGDDPEIYSLCVQLFPLTVIENRNGQNDTYTH